MADDGGIGGVAGLTSELQSQQHSGLERYSLPGDLEIGQQLEAYMRQLRPAVDSPKSLLIIRNAALTLLEVEGAVELPSLFPLVADKEYRRGIVDRLSSETPNYWDEAWNQAWTKQIEPLYSSVQQRIARRRSLLSFWTKEWDTLPEDQTQRVSKILEALA